MQLSTNLKAVISQLLLPRKDGTGRIAAFEVMINTPSIGALIRDNKTFRIAQRHPDRRKIRHGLARSIACELYLQGLITYEEVMSKAQDPEAGGPTSRTARTALRQNLDKPL